MNILENCNFVRLSCCFILRFILTTGAVARFSIRGIFCSLLICALLLPASQSIKAQGANPDSLALVALYNALDGPNWNDNTNWLTGEPVSSWYGITNNDNGRVETIELSYNNLSGTIPAEIGNLVNLEELKLHGNKLTGSIPHEIGNLVSLEYLSFADNQITGSIPPEIGNLTNLEYLSLHDNQLTGSIPQEIGNLTNLQSLRIGDNQLTDSIPSEIGNLANLDVLELYYNQLTGSIPPEIGNLSNLSYLLLHGNQLTGSIPPDIGNLTNLEKLSIGSNQFTGTIPPEIGNLVNLEYLELHNNQLTGTIPPEIGNLTNLHLLSLGTNQLTGTIPPELGDLVNLQYLILIDNQHTGTIPPEIWNLVNLVDLCLSVNQLTGTIPPEIGNLVNLKHLDLVYNQLTGTIPPEIANLENLRYLSLGINQLTGNIPPEIGNLVNLEYLKLNNNQLTGNIPPEIGNLTNLKSLQLNYNQFTGSIPLEIKNLVNLSYLYLYNNKFTNMPNITTLNSSAYIRVYDNRLTFEDIEPNVGHFRTFVYVPQDSVGMRKDTTVAMGSSFTLSVQVGGSANRYQWIKDGTDITEANDSTLAMSSVQASDAGEYLCKITNTIATDLTLYSNYVTVHVDTTAIVVFSETDTLNVVTLPADSSTVTVNFTNKSSLSINFTSGNVANNVLNVTQYSDISGSFPDVPVFNNGIFYYDIALEVDQFEAELTFGYTDSLLTALGIDEDSLAVSYYDSTDSRGYIWHSIPCVINKITNAITVTVNQFSLWALTGKEEPLITHITEQKNQYPDDFKLFSNYPNPFNPETTIVYQIPKSSFVTIKIYNVIGKAVKTLVNTQKNPGRYSVKWDGTNEFGQTVSSGLYIYRMQAGEFSSVEKMLFIK